MDTTWRATVFPLLLLLPSAVFAAKQCLLPNGAPGNYTPCNESAENSACCDPTDACLSNGYCFNQPNVTNLWNFMLSRGMCTDWSDPSCPYFCSDVRPYSTVTVLPIGDYQDGGWCCSSFTTGTNGNVTCDYTTHSGSAPFFLDQVAEIIVDRRTGATLSSIASSNVTTVGSSSSSSKSSDVAAVAAGIAAPLGVLLLAAIAAIVFLQRKVKRLQQSQSKNLGEMDHLDHSPGSYAKGGGGDPQRGWDTSHGQPALNSQWTQQVPQEISSSRPLRAWHEMGTEQTLNEAPGSVPQK